jgi:RHS repeat-associated protein
VTSITSSTIGGTLVAYQYDALNRLTNVVDSRLAGATNTAYGFDAVGNLQGIQYPNSVTSQYQYDSLNRLTSLVWKNNGTPIASFAYTLGASGNRTALLETNHTVNRGYAWNYDAVYRLTSETVTGAAPTGAIGYIYDNVGNRTIRTNIASGLGLTNQSFTFNANDWLAGDTYDNNGNTTNSSSKSYQYDYENRLINFNNGQVIIVYDADGNRVKKITGTTNTLYLVDTHNPSGYAQVLEEFTVSGGVTNLAKAYTYGLNLISQRTLNSQLSTNYFVYDGHGSTRMLTDKGGNFVNAFTYDAYGNLIASNGVPQTVYLYACQQWDTDLGQYYNRARTWQPNTGRFWTSDSYAGNNEDPLSLHKYLYAEDDPEDHCDPSGLTIWCLTRRTVGFPLGGFGRHAYFWDDRSDAELPSVSQQDICRFWGDPGITSERSEKGPIRADANVPPAPGFHYVDNINDIDGYPIPGTEGSEKAIMVRFREIANRQWFDPPYYDCHTAVERAFKDMKLTPVPHRKYNNGWERAAVLAYHMARQTNPITAIYTDVLQLVSWFY